MPRSFLGRFLVSLCISLLFELISDSSLLQVYFMLAGIGKRKSIRLVGLDDFEIISLVGTGAFGKVFRVKEKKSGQVFAMKVMSKADIVEHDFVRHVNQERDIMVELSAKNFFPGASHVPSRSLYMMNSQHGAELHHSFQTDTSVYLIMTFVGGGNLYHSVQQRAEPLSEEDARFYVAQVLLGLEEMHQRSIIYRDLKLENLLLDDDG